MTHPRQSIREAFAAAVTGLPTTGANVVIDSPLPMVESMLPGLRITAAGDTAEPLDLTSGAVLRTVEIACDVYAAAAESVSSILDVACEEVESAVVADRTLGGVAMDCQYNGCDIDVESADAQIGNARMRFSVLCAR